jgi:hypothetical protein
MFTERRVPFSQTSVVLDFQIESVDSVNELIAIDNHGSNLFVEGVERLEAERIHYDLNNCFGLHFCLFIIL